MKHIWPYLKPLLNPKSPYIEAMVGGGSIALQVAAQFPKQQIILNDLDPLIAAFWRVVCGQEGGDAFNALCQKVDQSRIPADDPVQRFAFWRRIRESKPANPVDAAFRFLLLNKTTFGGQIEEGPMGGWRQDGWQCHQGGRGLMHQYRPDNVLRDLKKAHELLVGRTTVFNRDGLQLWDEYEPGGTAFYDPPYILSGGSNNFTVAR